MTALSPTYLNDVRASLCQKAQEGSGASFQSTLAAAARAVRQAQKSEAAALNVALSLAQREVLDALCAELNEAAETLEAALDEQGRCLLAPAPKRSRALRQLLDRASTQPPPPSWWQALDEAAETLESGADRLADLADSQPSHAPAHTVAATTAALLREHHRRLLCQSERWFH